MISKKVKIAFIAFLICTPLVFSPGFSQEHQAFFNQAQLIKNPGSTQTHNGQKRRFTGIPSLAISQGGRMWAVWYTGISPEEDHNNYVVVATSGDGGNSWEEVLAIDPDMDGPVRAFDPEIWVDPDGLLWVFWGQAIGHDGSIAGVWSISTKKPENKNPKWTEPRRLTNGIMMCKPVVLSSGEWVLPASTWRIDGSQRQDGRVHGPRQFLAVARGLSNSGASTKFRRA